MSQNVLNCPQTSRNVRISPKVSQNNPTQTHRGRNGLVLINVSIFSLRGFPHFMDIVSGFISQNAEGAEEWMESNRMEIGEGRAWVKRETEGIGNMDN